MTKVECIMWGVLKVTSKHQKTRTPDTENDDCQSSMNDITGLAAMRKTGCGVLVGQGLEGEGRFRYEGEKRSERV